jgi:tRNA pseudouridine synthase 10
MKFSRRLSQTPWVVDGRRIGTTSVEELIAGPAKEVFRAEVSRFSSAGREDIDVRMLGGGRPFVLELENPRITEDALLGEDYARSLLEQLQTRIQQGSQLIRVERLSLVAESQLELLKQGEDVKRKTYM